MTRPAVRIALCIAACITCWSFAGCAGGGKLLVPPDGRGAARNPAGQPLTPQAAADRVVIGQSSKADVAAALGQAIAIPFDNGHEVWVYRWPGAEPTARAATELVLLFAPSGLVAKVRLRPGQAGP